MNTGYKHISYINERMNKMIKIRKIDDSSLKVIIMGINTCIYLLLLIFNILYWHILELNILTVGCMITCIIFTILHLYTAKEIYTIFFSYLNFALLNSYLFILFIYFKDQEFVHKIYSLVYLYNNFSHSSLIRFTNSSQIILLIINSLCIIGYNLFFFEFKVYESVLSMMITIILLFFENKNYSQYVSLSMENQIRKVKNLFFSNLINNFNFGYVIIDKRFNLIYKNKFFEKNLKFLIMNMSINTSDIIYKFINSDDNSYN